MQDAPIHIEQQVIAREASPTLLSLWQAYCMSENVDPTGILALFETLPKRALIQVFFSAIKQNHLLLAQAILAKKPLIDATNLNGDKPLHIACKSASKELIMWLIASGADCHAKNHQGGNSLAILLNESDLPHNEIADIVYYFLDQGVCPNTKLQFGRYPLHAALKTGNYELIKALIDHGAVLTFRESEKTAILLELTRCLFHPSAPFSPDIFLLFIRENCPLPEHLLPNVAKFGSVHLFKELYQAINPMGWEDLELQAYYDALVEYEKTKEISLFSS